MSQPHGKFTKKNNISWHIFGLILKFLGSIVFYGNSTVLQAVRPVKDHRSEINQKQKSQKPSRTVFVEMLLKNVFRFFFKESRPAHEVVSRDGEKWKQQKSFGKSVTWSKQQFVQFQVWQTVT